MNEELLNIREKGQYETYTEYLEWINKEIEKHNQIIMSKNSEISELKTKIANLEAEKSKAEKSQLDSELIDVVNDLKSNIKLLSDLSKKNSDDVKIDVLISKNSELMDEIYKLNSESKEIKEELSKPVNFGGIQDYIHRQSEIEDEIKDIHEIVSKLNKTVENVMSNQQTNSLNINNMEQALNLVSDQPVQEDSEIPDAKPMTEQMDNYENELNNGINQEEISNEEVSKEQENVQDNINPFDQALNPEMNAPKETPVSDVPEENVAPAAVVPNVAPFVNNDTIAPDASILNSIVQQENVETPVNEENNVIEETQNTENNIGNEEVQQPIVSEEAQKVEGVEEAPQETIEQARQVTNLNASAIKARRGFVNKSKESEAIEQIFNMNTWLLNGVEMTQEMKDYFNSSLPVENQEQAKVR